MWNHNILGRPHSLLQVSAQGQEKYKEAQTEDLCFLCLFVANFAEL